jgi:ferrous iron transport protein B
MQRDEKLQERVRVAKGAHAAVIEEANNALVFERRVDLHLRISLKRKRICKGLLDSVVVQQAEIRMFPLCSVRLP